MLTDASGSVLEELVRTTRMGQRLGKSCDSSKPPNTHRTCSSCVIAFRAAPVSLSVRTKKGPMFSSVHPPFAVARSAQQNNETKPIRAGKLIFRRLLFYRELLQSHGTAPQPLSWR